MSTTKCIGWWEQHGLGRQPMENLEIEFSDGLIHGSGRDVVGQFTMTGTMELGGHVRIVKQYTGRHHVIYTGHYDGEGTLFGAWLIDFMAGSWSIRLLRDREQDQKTVQEIRPVDQAG